MSTLLHWKTKFMHGSDRKKSKPNLATLGWDLRAWFWWWFLRFSVLAKIDHPDPVKLISTTPDHFQTNIQTPEMIRKIIKMLTNHLCGAISALGFRVFTREQKPTSQSHWKFFPQSGIVSEHVSMHLGRWKNIKSSLELVFDTVVIENSKGIRDSRRRTFHQPEPLWIVSVRRYGLRMCFYPSGLMKKMFPVLWKKVLENRFRINDWWLW